MQTPLPAIHLAGDCCSGLALMSDTTMTALAREAKSDRPPNAGAGARYYRDLVFKLH
jgi:hypothetical protein